VLAAVRARHEEFIRHGCDRSTTDIAEERMAAPLRIGIIGDFEPAYHSHFATNAALYDAAAKLKLPVELRWLPTPSLEERGAEKILRRSHGLVASPGSPYQSFSGMLRGIEFARTRDWPFVGT
jgi:CTP synthase (UTP-ammonia lyase)